MQKQRVCYLLICAAILSIAAGSFLGCSPQRRYEVLSFFFDGVPNPAVTGNVAVAAGGQPVAYLHKPYADGRCSECHLGGDMEMSISRAIDIRGITSKVCQKCHEKVPTQYPFMHGPVAVGECLLCHAPHESPNAHLLQAKSPRLCVQCHVPELMGTQRPEHADDKADCLTCHVGHGSGARGLLRPKPATRPAVSMASTQPADGLVAEPATTQPSFSALERPAATRPAVSSLHPSATTRPAVSDVRMPAAGGGI